MYSKKEKKEMFVDLNRVLNTKQDKQNGPDWNQQLQFDPGHSKPWIWESYISHWI